jgi:hypothetical protein
MSKAILVMDMPKSCSECPCISLGCCNAVGGVGFCRTIGDIYDKPDWCPLRELPKKWDENKALTWENKKFIDGRNACIDEITKGSEENGYIDRRKFSD